MPIALDEMSYKLDLKEELDKAGIDKSKRKTALEAVGMYILGEIKSYVDKTKSPVKGQGGFKALEKEYKKYKKKLGKGSKADLQLTGDMLNTLKVKSTQKYVKLEITKGKEIKKAYNHNVGDTLPQRQFLPDDNDSESAFKRNITSGIKKVIEEFKDGNED